MAMREKDDADFDLEQFIELFDEAVTSNDPRVKQALGHMMTITALCMDHSMTRGRRSGPLRRMFEDMGNIARRIDRMENEMRRSEYANEREETMAEQKVHARQVDMAAMMAQPPSITVPASALNKASFGLSLSSVKESSE